MCKSPEMSGITVLQDNLSWVEVLLSPHMTCPHEQEHVKEQQEKSSLNVDANQFAQ